MSQFAQNAPGGPVLENFHLAGGAHCLQNFPRTSALPKIRMNHWYTETYCHHNAHHTAVEACLLKCLFLWEAEWEMFIFFSRAWESYHLQIICIRITNCACLSCACLSCSLELSNTIDASLKDGKGVIFLCKVRRLLHVNYLSLGVASE